MCRRHTILSLYCDLSALVVCLGEENSSSMSMLEFILPYVVNFDSAMDVQGSKIQGICALETVMTMALAATLLAFTRASHVRKQRTSSVICNLQPCNRPSLQHQPKECRDDGEIPTDTSIQLACPFANAPRDITGCQTSPRLRINEPGGTSSGRSKPEERPAARLLSGRPAAWQSGAAVQPCPPDILWPAATLCPAATAHHRAQCPSSLAVRRCRHLHQTDCSCLP